MTGVDRDGPKNGENGVGRLYVNMADLTLALISRDPSLRMHVQGPTKDFVVHGTEPDVTVSVAWGDLSGEWNGRTLFDSGGIWQLCHQNGCYCYRFTSPAFGPHPYKVATFHPDLASVEVYFHRDYFDPDRPVDPLEHPLHELLISNVLTQGKGAKLHACGLVDASGDGHLFVGHSGAGKTTTARLWQQREGVKILSDDRIILRKRDHRLRMYGTPWHGEAELALPSGGRLTGVYFLGRGQRNELVPLGPAEAVERLVVCSYPPFHSPSGIAFTLEFLEEVARSIPCYQLNFVPDGEVVRFVQQHTLKGSQHDG